MMFLSCLPMCFWRKPYSYSLIVTNNWFNETYKLYLSRQDVDLLRAATKDQLFIFNGRLYEQADGVPMGSPLGPLLANVFMRSIEERLEHNGKMPT